MVREEREQFRSPDRANPASSVPRPKMVREEWEQFRSPRAFRAALQFPDISPTKLGALSTPDLDWVVTESKQALVILRT
jgi:hypothetical protein